MYELKPGLVFDCRFTGWRRMGIGDQLCLVSALQAVSEKIGGRLTIAYDPAFPGSEAVFSMSGLPCTTTEPEPDADVVPCRNHLFDPPLGGTGALYAETTGCPVSQVFYNLGWTDIFQAPPVRLRLFPEIETQWFADAIIQGGENTPYITCTPLEISRGNDDVTAQIWNQVLARYGQRILFGCAPSEVEQLKAFIAAMNIGQPHKIITATLPAWKCIIDKAEHNLTGNSCGMWLAFASSTPTTILQNDSKHHKHNALWNYKPEWDCSNIDVITVGRGGQVLLDGPRHSTTTCTPAFPRAQGQNQK